MGTKQIAVATNHRRMWAGQVTEAKLGQLPLGEERPPLRVIFHGEVPKKVVPVVEPKACISICAPEMTVGTVFCPLVSGWNDFILHARSRALGYDCELTEAECLDRWISDGQPTDYLLRHRLPQKVSRYLWATKNHCLALTLEQVREVVAMAYATGFGAHYDRIQASGN